MVELLQKSLLFLNYCSHDQGKFTHLLGGWHHWDIANEVGYIELCSILQHYCQVSEAGLTLVTAEIPSHHTLQTQMGFMEMGSKEGTRTQKWQNCMTYPRNWAPAGPTSTRRLARPSPSTMGGGEASLCRLTRRQVMRVGAVHLRGGMMMRIPLWRLPRIEPPRASTMKLTRNL